MLGKGVYRSKAPLSLTGKNPDLTVVSLLRTLTTFRSGSHSAESGKPSFKRLAVVIYLLSVQAVLYLFFKHWAYDDPFITYRYARNLSDGVGFVYNPGERVLSTTTPLFTLLLALFYNLSPDLPHIAILIGAFSLVLGGYFLWDLSRSWNSPLVGWVALFIYPTFPLLSSTLGSETPLYLVLCLGAFAFYARKNYALTAVLAALAVLARPDGILVALLLASHYIFCIRREVPWKALAVFLGITGAWFTFAWVYFGTPIPATLGAKQGQGAMAISQRFAPGFLTVIQPYAGRINYWLEAALAMLGISIVALRKRRWALLLLWPVIYFLAYSVLGVTRYFWYYAPLVPGFVIAVGLGVVGVDQHRSVQKGLKTKFHGGLSGSFPLLLLLTGVMFLSQGSDLFQLRYSSDERFFAYKAVGDWLDQHTTANATVGALEVGIIGYYSHRPMVDFAGLIQPQVAAQFNKDANYEDAAIWAVDHYKPDYLVVHDGILQRLEEGYVEKQCTLAQHFSGSEYGYSSDLSVYSCN